MLVAKGLHYQILYTSTRVIFRTIYKVLAVLNFNFYE
jgi:hypothetical protein